MTKRTALITGISGGIGTALGLAFRDAGYRVVGTALEAPAEGVCDHFIETNISAATSDAKAICRFRNLVHGLSGGPVAVLVNNAATQILGGTEVISISDWETSLAVNLTAPFRLVQAFIDDLRRSKGSVLNIGSVHAQSTKPEFVAYATSKAALHGLTRALAVDLGPDIRVVCLAPAAIATPMLMAGFAGRDSAFRQLEAVHPAERIGRAGEVADVALFLVSDKAGFATGSTFYLDGGILSRLHDPI